METYDFSIPKIWVWIAPFIFAGVFALCSNFFAYLTRPPHCVDFKTAKEAQALYLSNPSKYTYLDINHNGVACDGL